MNDKDKDKILECTKELQSAMFRDEDPSKLFIRLKSKYGVPTIELSMKLLEKSRLDIESPDPPRPEGMEMDRPVDEPTLVRLGLTPGRLAMPD